MKIAAALFVAATATAAVFSVAVASPAHADNCAGTFPGSEPWKKCHGDPTVVAANPSNYPDGYNCTQLWGCPPPCHLKSPLGGGMMISNPAVTWDPATGMSTPPCSDSGSMG